MSVVFSDDGNVADWSGSQEIKKIVVGTPTTRFGSAPPIELTTQLPEDFSELYPALTHLYLWQISNLTELPKLPAGLRCLDVRGCGELKRIATLPETLEELDASECVKLQTLPVVNRIRRLYLNKCEAISTDTLRSFLRRLEVEPGFLEHFEAARNPHLRMSLVELLPPSLRRIVLEGCSRLDGAFDVTRFPFLQHLNLSNCPELTDISALPTPLQYLQLFGSEKLEGFCGQGIGLYERGSAQEPNVAPRLRTRAKFGEHITVNAGAKLLLLGDGRVGKTTLIKRILWESLNPSEQKDPHNLHLKPSEKESFTHSVKYSRWDTQLQVTAEVAKATNRRAVDAKLAAPVSEDGGIAGTVRIWDFGGQEIYHQTHRVFAAQDSVYLIVWNANKVDESSLREEYDRGVRGIDWEEWKEWNRRRSLNYWLDYIDSLGTKAKVALVCTYCSATDRPQWEDTLNPRHRKREGLKCFYIDSLDERCGETSQWQELTKWLREAAGGVAARIGLLQPAFYGIASAEVLHLLQENERARRDVNKTPEHLILTKDDWHTRLRELQRNTVKMASLELESSDVEHITEYLHDSGHLFRIRDPRPSAVLIDQTWATDLIYELLRPQADNNAPCLFNIIRHNGGYFDEDILPAIKGWKDVSSEAYRKLLLSYMEQCGIVVSVSDRQSSCVDGGRTFVATEKWLLPKYEGEIKRHREAIFETVLVRGGSRKLTDFAFDSKEFSDLDFRQLFIHFARKYRSHLTVFRDGLYLTNARSDPKYMLMLRWKPDNQQPDAYYGQIVARLAAPEAAIEELARQVGSDLAGNESPLREHATCLVPTFREDFDFSSLFFEEITDKDVDVAISFSGRDQDVVSQLKLALNNAQVNRVYVYDDPACREDETKPVMPFMKSLRNPPCLILFLSDNYLRNHPDNWYCLWEFADAILRLSQGKMNRQQIMVIYKKGGELNSKSLAQTAAVAVAKMADYYNELFSKVRTSDVAVSRIFLERFIHFEDARGERLVSFVRERGDEGRYCKYTESGNGEFDFSEIIAEVKRQLEVSRQ